MAFEAGAGEGDTRLEGCNRYATPLEIDRFRVPSPFFQPTFQGPRHKTRQCERNHRTRCKNTKTPDKESERAKNNVKRMFVFRKFCIFILKGVPDSCQTKFDHGKKDARELLTLQLKINWEIQIG